MSAGFTPGPWGVEDPMGPETLSIIGNPSEPVYNWLFVAQVWLDDQTDGGGAFIERDTGVANANLIAAAPDLYAALTAFIAGADAGHISVETDNAARAALSKARGEA